MLSWSWMFGGAFLGWSLGANDACNVFGTAVATHAVRFRTAAFWLCIFVVLGAFLQGAEGIATLSAFSTGATIQTAFTTAFTAAVSVTILTVLKLPVSTSQAVVGAIIGISLALGHTPNWTGLPKIVLCWVGTPLGAMIISAVLYLSLGRFWDWFTDRAGIHVQDAILSLALIAAGSYGAYALGANNIANVVGVFAPFPPFNTLDVKWLAALGAAAVCLGVVTYPKRGMFTVGQDLVPLEPFTAFIAVLSEAVTVHIYALVGVPVSTSQAIVGAVLGIGIIKGVQSVNTKVLLKIVIGWLSTPISAGLIAFAFYKFVFVILLPVR